MKIVPVRLPLILLAFLAVPSATTFAGNGQPLPGDAVLLRFERALSWVVDFKLTQDARASFREAVVADWRTTTPQTQAAFEPNLQAIERMMRLEPLEREVVRLTFRKKILSDAESNASEPLARFVLGARNAAHRPIASGSPALTREISDALLVLLNFIQSEVKGLPEPILTKSVKEQAAAALASKWAGMSTEERRNAVDVPLTLAALRFKWRKLGADERDTIRVAWRHRFGDPKDRTATRREVSAKRQENILSEVESNLMISNMQRQMHQMNMSIITNMPGSSSRYIYR